MNGRWRPLGAVVFVLPAAFFAAELALRAHALPYWLWFNLDPSYLYLLDGMQLLEGVTPGNVNHPGTPVQCIVALVVWLSGLGSPSGISDATFAAAESLLRSASTIILALDAAALVLLGWVAERRFGMIPALLAQTTPFLTMLTLKHGIEVEPEPMLLLGVLLLGTAVIEYASRPRLWLIVAMGVVIGLGSASKITFAPLGLAPLLLIAGWRARAFFVAASALSFAIFLLPAIGGAAQAATWFADLAIGSGTYGGGRPIVVDPERYPHAVVKLFFARPLFLAPFFVAAAVLAWRRLRGLRASGYARALFAILMAQLVQILLVAKHPSGHYILPALELGGTAMVLLWPVADELAQGAQARAVAQFGFVAALVVIIVAQALAFYRQDRELSREAAGALSIDLARDLPSCAHVYYDMASSPSQAWLYNLNFGSHPFRVRLAGLIPADDYSYLSWVGRLQDRSGFVEPASVAARYSCIALRGTSLAPLTALGASFGPLFDRAATCRAGSEFILVAGASCPGAAGS
ncbi:MAG TPA: hypothetical protein VN832_12470 [Stellaceae bacterium]|nr:hypothetical protein [Stellaceae bacterium]